jgi:hypothetical protein
MLEAVAHPGVEFLFRQLVQQFGVGVYKQQVLHGGVGRLAAGSGDAILRVTPVFFNFRLAAVETRVRRSSWKQEAVSFRSPDHRRIPMRVMVMVKATQDSEAGVMPDPQLLSDMGKFNEELVKAGVILAGEGLKPSSKGARVRFSGSNRSVIDGPFAETKELVAGFWLWQVRSMDEAIEWVRRCPNPHPGECEIEIRPVFEAEDFGDALTPETRARNEGLRGQTAAKP